MFNIIINQHHYLINKGFLNNTILVSENDGHIETNFKKQEHRPAAIYNFCIIYTSII